MFWTWKENCTYQLTTVVIVCIRPAQKQANQHADMNEGKVHKCLSIPEELLTAYDSFAFNDVTLVDGPIPMCLFLTQIELSGLF